MKPEKLSPTERIILSNQYRILELLNPRKFNSTEADHYAELRKIVESGDVARYGELSRDLKDEMAFEQSVVIDKKNILSKSAKGSRV